MPLLIIIPCLIGLLLIGNYKFHKAFPDTEDNEGKS